VLEYDGENDAYPETQAFDIQGGHRYVKFQIQIWQDGHVACMFDEVEDDEDGNPGSVGIQDATGERGVRYYFGEIDEFRKGIRFFPQGNACDPTCVDTSRGATLVGDMEINAAPYSPQPTGAPATITADLGTCNAGYTGSYSVTFVVGGANPRRQTVPVSSEGLATLEYAGARPGLDQVTATVTSTNTPEMCGVLTGESATLTYGWYGIDETGCPAGPSPYQAADLPSTIESRCAPALIGALVRDSGLGVLIPEPGSSHLANALTCVGSKEFSIRTDESGIHLEGVGDELGGVIPACPPNRPTNLTALPLSPNAVQLTWEDNSEDETHFQLERATTESGPYSVILDNYSHVGNEQPTWSDRNVLSSTTYFYRVRAINSAGPSNYSNTASATPQPPPAPSAPSALNTSASSTTQIQLAWSDNSNNEDQFRVERATATNGVFTQIASLPAQSTSYGDSGLSPSTTYIYRVRASNGTGSSGYSNHSSATTNSATPPSTPPSAPSGLSAQSTSSSQIHLSWSDNSANEDGFIVQRSASSSGPFNDLQTLTRDTREFWDNGLASNTNYWYRVRAFNSAGASSNSSVAYATTMSPPSKPKDPSNLTAQGTSQTQIRLDWRDNSSNEEGFIIDRAEALDGGYNGAFTELARVGPNVVQFFDNGLPAGSDYYYRVRAYNSQGNSLYCAPAYAGTSTPPPQAPPNAPSNLRAVAQSKTSIALYWNDNSSNEQGFSIQRQTNGQSWLGITTVGANTSSYIDYALSPGSTYTYRVSSYNNGGSSDFATPATATTLPEDPPPPPPSETEPQEGGNAQYPYAEGQDAIDGSMASCWPDCPPPCQDDAFNLAQVEGEPYKETDRNIWSLNTDSAPIHQPPGEPQMTVADVEAALRHGRSNVTNQRTNCDPYNDGRYLQDQVSATSQYGGPDNGRRAGISSQDDCTGQDFHNTTDFGDLQDAVGLTCAYTRGTQGEFLELSEADIRLNKVDYNWTLHPNRSDCDVDFDIEAAFTHESAHVYGMGHVGPRNHGRLTMAATAEGFYCTGEKRSLGLGDILGLRYLY
jgi:hypothetical protein